MKKIDYREFIESNLIDCDISYRGGSVKIDVSDLFYTGDEPAIMGAYQNYLGGGIAGSIQVGMKFNPKNLDEKDQKVFFELSSELKKWFYNQNNGGGDDYMQEEVTGSDAGGFERLQKMPVSGY